MSKPFSSSNPVTRMIVPVLTLFTGQVIWTTTDRQNWHMDDDFDNKNYIDSYERGDEEYREPRNLRLSYEINIR